MRIYPSKQKSLGSTDYQNHGTGKATYQFQDKRPSTSARRELQRVMAHSSTKKKVLFDHQYIGQQQFTQSNPIDIAAGLPIQLAYNKTAVLPSTILDVVAKRSADKSRSCYGKARLLGPDKDLEAIRQSGAAGANFHAERNAISSAMGKGFIPGFKNNNGTDTGIALKAGGIENVTVYTEFPPCGECDPWLENLEAKIDGDVNASFSDELEVWYETDKKSEKTKLWGNHLKAIEGVADKVEAKAIILPEIKEKEKEVEEPNKITLKEVTPLVLGKIRAVFQEFQTKVDTLKPTEDTYTFIWEGTPTLEAFNYYVFGD